MPYCIKIVYILVAEANTMADKEHLEKLRQKYMADPPEGMTSEMIRKMSDGDLLDMDYFLHEFDDFDEDDSDGGFYIF